LHKRTIYNAGSGGTPCASEVAALTPSRPKESQAGRNEFELVVNLRVAKTIGHKIPAGAFARR
jgi:hypothetical protein